MLNGVADQLEDLEDFQQWYCGTSPAVLQREAPGYEIDYR
jgi:hypothetical protein